MVQADMIQVLLEQSHRDRERIEALERNVAKLQGAISLDRPAPRKLSKAQAKNEIRAYFAQRDGQVVYPSDIAEALNLDFDLVSAAVHELEKEGKVAKT